MSLTANIRPVQSSAYYEHHGGDCSLRIPSTSDDSSGAAESNMREGRHAEAESLRGVTEAMAFAAAPFPSCYRRGTARSASFAWRVPVDQRAAHCPMRAFRLR